ncbi:MAG: phasin [Xanthobacteraceae bacterium]
MSNAAMRVDATARPKAPKTAPFPNTTFELPTFEMPKFEMPAAIRDFVETGGAQAKENYETMQTATDEMIGMVEATYAITAEGATDYGLKVIEITRSNANAAFDFIGKLVAVKSPSEAVELLTAHARQQFDAVSEQNKDLWALSQKVATDLVEPVKTRLSKVLQRND